MPSNRRLTVIAAVFACGLSVPAIASATARAGVLSCAGTVERAGAEVTVQVRISRPEAHDRMLALVDRSRGMAQQVVRPQVGEGTIEITESVRGVARSTQRYPFIELRSPDSPAGMPLIGVFFAGDLNPAVLRADLWDTPMRFTIGSARDARVVSGQCQ